MPFFLTLPSYPFTHLIFLFHMTMFLREALWVCLLYEKCYIHKGCLALPCLENVVLSSTCTLTLSLRSAGQYTDTPRAAGPGRGRRKPSSSLWGKLLVRKEIFRIITLKDTALCAGMPLIIVFTSRLIHLMHTFYIKTNESEITDKQPVIIDWTVNK